LPDSVGESEARSAAVQEETAVPVVVLALAPVAQRQPVGDEGLYKSSAVKSARSTWSLEKYMLRSIILSIVLSIVLTWARRRAGPDGDEPGCGRCDVKRAGGGVPSGPGFVAGVAAERRPRG